jgi:hypothetical protein
MRHPLVLIVLVAVFAFVVYGLVSVVSGNDVTSVRRTINAAILGVELNDPARYGAILAEDYTDNQGFTRATLLSRLAGFFKDWHPYKVDVKRLKISVKDQNEATANIGFKAYFHKKGDEVAYYEAGKAVLSLRKTGAGWRVYRVEYTGTDDLLFIQSVA